MWNDLLNIPLPQTSLSGKDKLKAPEFGLLLGEWNQTLIRSQRGRNLRLVLLLDECEQITKKPWTARLYANLRSLLVDQKRRNLLKLVMAGSHRFSTQVRQRGSPLHNALKFHTLRVLDKEATTNLVTQPTEGIVADEVVKTVTSYSGGHPFLTQYLMHHLVEDGLEKATPETVQRIATLLFPKERSDFWDWTNYLGNTSLEVYKILADSDGSITENDIRSTMKPAPPDLVQALDTLCYHGLVMQEPDQKSYRIAGQMYREWFVTNIMEHLEYTLTASGNGMNYLGALDRMRETIEHQSPHYLNDFLTLEARLRENLGSSQISGDTPTTRAERAQIIASLNALAQQAELEMAFNDLCRE